MEASATIRNYVAIQTMANDKCPEAIKKETGEQVYFPSETKSDKETYITLIWLGENTKTGGFKKASCTLHAALGGISELIVDDKVIIKKKSRLLLTFDWVMQILHGFNQDLLLTCYASLQLICVM